MHDEYFAIGQQAVNIAFGIRTFSNVLFLILRVYKSHSLASFMEMRNNGRLERI